MAIAWLVRDHHATIRVQGDWPVSLSEVQTFLPGARRLRVDDSPRRGLIVLDGKRNTVGYAVRTMPECSNVIGYSGPTDALIVFDEKGEVAGVSIRHSYDTPSHVEDVTLDLLFMESWNGKSWDEIAAIDDYSDVGIYAVSGASRTSEALMESIRVRLQAGVEEAAEEEAIRMRFGWRDGMLLGFFAIGCLFAFWKNARLQKLRWLYSILTIAVLGFWMGDLIAQSLLVGWLESRVPWEMTPGIVLLVAGSFLVPWFTKQPVYCQFICPHGNLQRWTRGVLPARWKKPIHDEVKIILRILAPVLLVVVLIVSFLQLDLDLAGIEPFDAYLVTSAGAATLVVAVVSILVSFFYPMAYCKFGCPTGWLLEFVRRRSGGPRFGKNDWIGLGLLAAAVALQQGWIGIG